MGTSNCEDSLEERLPQFVVSYGNKKLSKRLDECVIQFVAWKEGNKLRKKSRVACIIICGIIWGKQTHKWVLKSVSYSLWNHVGTTNLEGCLEKCLILLVVSYENVLKRILKRKSRNCKFFPWNFLGLFFGQNSEQMTKSKNFGRNFFGRNRFRMFWNVI